MQGAELQVASCKVAELHFATCHLPLCNFAPCNSTTLPPPPCPKKLSPEQKRLLAAIAAGQRLKDHRDIEGGKNYRLYALDGAAQVIQPSDVAALVELGLISSNKKFPSATYWLTPQGQQYVISLT